MRKSVINKGKEKKTIKLANRQNRMVLPEPEGNDKVKVSKDKECNAKERSQYKTILWLVKGTIC